MKNNGTEKAAESCNSKNRFTCIFDEKEITARIGAVAAQINADYAGKNLVAVCVLKGAFMFFSDLVKQLVMEPELDFVRVSSYCGQTESSRAVTITKDLEVNVQGKHVLLVEDIVDTGHTIAFLTNHLQARGACDVRVAALVDKTERREVPVKAAYVALNLPEGFIVGYGLDYKEKYRELPGIYLVDLDA